VQRRCGPKIRPASAATFDGQAFREDSSRCSGGRAHRLPSPTGRCLIRRARHAASCSRISRRATVVRPGRQNTEMAAGPATGISRRFCSRCRTGSIRSSDSVETQKSCRWHGPHAPSCRPSIGRCARTALFFALTTPRHAISTRARSITPTTASFCHKPRQRIGILLKGLSRRLRFSRIFAFASFSS